MDISFKSERRREKMLLCKLTVSQLLGLIMGVTLVTFAVMPVLAVGEQSEIQMDEHSIDFQMAREKFSHFSYEGYDERHHSPIQVPQSYAAIENLTIDGSLINTTPHWFLLAGGKTEQKVLLDYIQKANVSGQKKVKWTFFLMTTWMKYPVKYIKTVDGGKLIPGRTPYKFSLNPWENATFQEIEAYIAEDMNQTAVASALDQTDIITPQWAPVDHHSMTTIACTKENTPIKPINLIDLAGAGAEEPDSWYEYSGGTQVHSLEHGYVPLGVPGMGICLAPAKCSGYATLAKDTFQLHDYSTAFTNLGYATHFMQDLGEPYHTPQVQIIPLQYIDDPTYYKQDTLYGVIINYQTLHNAYETFFHNYWSATLPQGGSFGSLAEGVTDYQTISDPKAAAETLASESWSMNPSLVYYCYYYWLGTRTFDFQNNNVIVQKTKLQVIQTQRYTRGLVHYVSGGQQLLVTITSSAGNGGRISPSGAVTANFGDTPEFTITPDNGYTVDQILVDGSPVTDNPFRFLPVTADHTISVTFKKQILAGIVPLCLAGTAFNATAYPQYTPESDPMVFTCNWDGNGRVFISGNQDSLTKVDADDGFTINIQPSGATFDAAEHWAHPHPILELTSGMTPGSNTFTLIVQNWKGLSMSYGSSTSMGGNETPYIIEVNGPVSFDTTENLSAISLPSFINRTSNGMMINGTLDKT
jgi:hypothetical protein